MQGARTTGVMVYAIHLAQYLEREFRCAVIAPRNLCHLFANPVECPPPLAVRGIPICRNLLSKAWAQVQFGDDTLIYAPHMRGFFFQRNQIITIHDLIHHYYPTRNFLENAYNRYLLPRLIERVRGVFTVSESAKDDLRRFYGIDAAKIHVVPNGIDRTVWHPQARPAGEEYLLTVSANRPYKNTVELLQCHPLWASEYRLKIVSSKARYGRAIREAVIAMGLAGKVDFLDDLTEAQLIDVYRNSAAVVYPSLMEGFGRPALEAMAVGRPVILSDIPVHKETFAGAAFFITPGRRDTWESAFIALKDRRLVEDRTNQGLLIADRHTWENCGKKLAERLRLIEPSLERL